MFYIPYVQEPVCIFCVYLNYHNLTGYILTTYLAWGLFYELLYSSVTLLD